MRGTSSRQHSPASCTTSVRRSPIRKSPRPASKPTLQYTSRHALGASQASAVSTPPPQPFVVYIGVVKIAQAVWARKDFVCMRAWSFPRTCYGGLRGVH